MPEESLLPFPAGLFLGLLLLSPCPTGAGEALALEPSDLLVVANEQVPAGIRLAKNYMEKRGVPGDRLLVISAGAKEECGRCEYEGRVALPIRRYLEEAARRGRPVRCILTVYGVPLRIAPPEPGRRERIAIEKLEEKRKALETLSDREDLPPALRKESAADLRAVHARIAALKKWDQGAALDSELALVRDENHRLAGWIPNPLLLGHAGKTNGRQEFRPIMVARLDGPSPETVERMIDDSLLAEQTGLRGVACFDARWPEPDRDGTRDTATAYERYDLALHRAARLISGRGTMPVVIDESHGLFPPGACPDTALYCGWYSLGKYIDAFTWRPGAVGYHMASSECRTLRQPDSRVWCKMMLERGATATLGPVAEPYLQAFPLPDIFFGLLIDGRLTLAECYALANPFWSWQMVLIGDPLYRPFQKGWRADPSNGFPEPDRP